MARRTALMKRSAIRELLKVTGRPEVISFAGGLPAPELFPIAEIQEATASALRRHGPACLQYGETEGVRELRERIARGFDAPGAPVRRENVVITSGSQQALDLIGRVFLDENDSVVVETPTYLALLASWRPLGIEFVPVPSDEHGIQPNILEDALTNHRPKLIYLVPNFQNPQGTTLSLERRLRIIELAQRYDIAIVEDDPYGQLRFSGKPLPHLFSMQNAERRMKNEEGGGPEAQGRELIMNPESSIRHSPSSIPHSAFSNLHSTVLFVGTFSKVLAPGFRVGWIVGPEVVVDKVVQAKQAADLHTSTLSQRIVCEIFDRIPQHVESLCQHYRQRRDAMLDSLERHFPSDVSWTTPEGGMFLLVSLPPGYDASKLLKRSIEHNVVFVPGEEFHIDGRGRNTFRLNFSNARPEQIEEGIRRLGSLL